MKLIGQLDSPFVRRAAVSLNHYGLSFESETPSVFADFEHILALNPLGRIPLMVLDDGELLLDSQSIVDFGESQASPSQRLVPAAEPQRRKSRQIEAVAIGIMEKSVELRLETVHKSAAVRDLAWISRLKRQIGSGLQWLERLQPSPWMWGEVMTRADVAAAIAYTNLLRKFPDLVPEGEHPRLAAHCRRAEALAPFAAAAYPS